MGIGEGEYGDAGMEHREGEYGNVGGDMGMGSIIPLVFQS